MFSGGVAIVSGATETATGLTGTKLNGEKLTEEEAQARISSGVQGIITGIAAIPAGLTGMQVSIQEHLQLIAIKQVNKLIVRELVGVKCLS